MSSSPGAPPSSLLAAPSLLAARRFCAAPMMRYSHRHARQLWRILCPPALLYTEMLTADAVLRGPRARLLTLPAGQRPVALQLGGGAAAALADAAKIGADFGYDEINLNCGCPSARVQRGQIGACLMLSPSRVAALTAAMKRAVSLPVTVKCRIAVDGKNDEEDLSDFIRVVAGAGADAFIVHARRAHLTGLNPAQNRRVPPLNHARVRRLKREFPRLPIVLNGGLQTAEDAAAALRWADGAMLGRAICRRPYLLAEAAARIYGAPAISRGAALRAMLAYIRALPAGEWRRALTPLAGLYHGRADSRHYRRSLALPAPAAMARLEQGAP